MAGKHFATFSVFALLALALTVLASSGTNATTYNPANDYRLTVAAAGAASDTDNDINIPAPDLNYEDSSMFSFTPIDGSATAGTAMPIGAGMGVLNSQATVGLINGACATRLPPSFPLYNASVDTTDVLSPADMFWVLKDKDQYPIPDTDGDGLEDYLERYPHFVNEMLDPDGAGSEPPLEPRARYAGHAFVANMNILIQFILLEPGDLLNLGGINSQLGPEIGYPSLIILDNPVSAEDIPGAISDFCTPMVTTTTLYGTTTDNPNTAADESGHVARQNPAAATGVLATGTHLARNYSRSERDADGDGIENDLDPCRYNDDTGWDPRAAGAQAGYDNDGDGLPNTCDPAPDSAKPDQDDDGYNNRLDNCPLVANGCQDSSCHPTLWNPAWDNQADDDSALAFDANADLGPNPDAIGNACDDSDDDGDEDGCGPGTCTDGLDNGAACDGSGVDGMDVLDPDCASAMDDADPTPWGTNPGTGTFFHAMPWAAVCVPDTNDSDGDGYCDALEDAMNDGLPAGTLKNNGAESGTDCDNALDDDGDTYVNDGCPMLGDYIETGTAECGDGVTLNTVSDDTPTPDAPEETLGAKVNDGCPVIGVPESLVIDVQINAPAAQPQADVPQSCSDGVDNDGDGSVDTDNQTLGCDPGHTSYDNDSDYDGYPDNPADNCSCIWNPEQTDSDANTVGDACEVDRDGDGHEDYIECYLPTDAFDDCTDVIGVHDAWPLDMDMNRVINLTGDAIEYVGNIGCVVATNPECKRLDLDMNGVINLTGDTIMYVGRIGESCT